MLAAENYPGRPRVGDVIIGAEADGVLHAGTARRDDGAVVSSGGRVLSVVGTGCRPRSGPRGRLRRHASRFGCRAAISARDIALAAAEGRIRVGC